MADERPADDDVRADLLAAARERLRVHLEGEPAETRDSLAAAEVQAFLERVMPPLNTD